MNIGSLYKVKQNFWLLFPTKETAAVGHDPRRPLLRPRSLAAAFPAYADYWSRQFNCEVTYLLPESFIVFLEEDGKYKKVLTSDGRIGWTWFDKNYKSCFEEMKVAV